MTTYSLSNAGKAQRPAAPEKPVVADAPSEQKTQKVFLKTPKSFTNSLWNTNKLRNRILTALTIGIYFIVFCKVIAPSKFEKSHLEKSHLEKSQSFANSYAKHLHNDLMTKLNSYNISKDELNKLGIKSFEHGLNVFFEKFKQDHPEFAYLDYEHFRICVIAPHLFQIQVKLGSKVLVPGKVLKNSEATEEDKLESFKAIMNLLNIEFNTIDKLIADYKQKFLKNAGAYPIEHSQQTPFERLFSGSQIKEGEEINLKSFFSSELIQDYFNYLSASASYVPILVEKFKTVQDPLQLEIPTRTAKYTPKEQLAQQLASGMESPQPHEFQIPGVELNPNEFEGCAKQFLKDSMRGCFPMSTSYAVNGNSIANDFSKQPSNSAQEALVLYSNRMKSEFKMIPKVIESIPLTTDSESIAEALAELGKILQVAQTQTFRDFNTRIFGDVVNRSFLILPARGAPASIDIAVKSNHGSHAPLKVSILTGENPSKDLKVELKFLGESLSVNSSFLSKKIDPLEIMELNYDVVATLTLKSAVPNQNTDQTESAPKTLEYWNLDYKMVMRNE